MCTMIMIIIIMIIKQYYIAPVSFTSCLLIVSEHSEAAQGMKIVSGSMPETGWRICQTEWKQVQACPKSCRDMHTPSNIYGILTTWSYTVPLAIMHVQRHLGTLHSKKAGPASSVS